MEEGIQNYSGQFGVNPNLDLRDIKEKQRILKDRLLLIGQNLIELKEKVSEENLELKKEIEILKQNMERMLSFLETASKEFTRFAKKEDLEILAKQVRIFQP